VSEPIVQPFRAVVHAPLEVDDLLDLRRQLAKRIDHALDIRFAGFLLERKEHRVPQHLSLGSRSECRRSGFGGWLAARRCRFRSRFTSRCSRVAGCRRSRRPRLRTAGTQADEKAATDQISHWMQ